MLVYVGDLRVFFQSGKLLEHIVRITVVLRVDTPKHVPNEPKYAKLMSFDVSNQFFLNWLFSWELCKEIFSQNWKKSETKKFTVQKKLDRLKLKLHYF